MVAPVRYEASGERKNAATALTAFVERRQQVADHIHAVIAGGAYCPQAR